MPYLLALLPATGLTIAGYFVLYLSTRTEGSLRSFGKYLAYWAFTLAGLVILGAIFAAAHHGHHHGMYCPWHGAHEEDWETRPGEGPHALAPPAPPATPGAESETPTPPTRQ
jgi:hypothetical protein